MDVYLGSRYVIMGVEMSCNRPPAAGDLEMLIESLRPGNLTV
jgi:hypothetical protein